MEPFACSGLFRGWAREWLNCWKRLSWLVITITAARWTIKRLAVPPTGPSRLGMGCVALGLLLLAEFTLVLWVRGLSIREYLAS